MTTKWMKNFKLHIHFIHQYQYTLYNIFKDNNFLIPDKVELVVRKQTHVTTQDSHNKHKITF